MSISYRDSSRLKGSDWIFIILLLIGVVVFIQVKLNKIESLLSNVTMDLIAVREDALATREFAQETDMIVKKFKKLTDTLHNVASTGFVLYGFVAEDGSHRVIKIDKYGHVYCKK